MSLITVELCSEDRARLDAVIDALANLTSCASCVASVAPLLEKASAIVDAAPASLVEPQKIADSASSASTPSNDTAPEADVAQTAADAPETAPWESPVVSLAEFQKALSLRCSESDAMKAKVRALLHEYAPAASQVPEAKRAEVMARLASL